MIIFEENKKILAGYKFIDLFCGIGGFHLALSSLGAECVFASDINEKACSVYKNNYNLDPHGDIKKIHCKNIPAHDILCAGFPCQPFSISGHKKGFEDKNGKLFFEIIRIARYHKPKVIFLENVKNLETHDDGRTLKTINEKLNGLGYYTFEKVLNASDYGVPQARKRIYIIAFKKSLKIKTFNFPNNESNIKCVIDILLHDVSEKYYLHRNDINISEDIEVRKRSKELVRIGSIGPGRQGERIYSVYGQAITLSSQGGGPGGKTGVYLTEKGCRILTPRECARVMGFPDSFIIPASDYEAYTQFGNSVVVDVIQKIAYEAAKNLKEVDKNE